MTLSFDDRVIISDDDKSATVDFDDGYDWYQASANMKNSAMPPLKHALNQVRGFAKSAEDGFSIVAKGVS